MLSEYRAAALLRVPPTLFWESGSSYVGMSGHVTPVLVTNPRDYIPEQKARYQAYILENIREYECALDSLYSKRNSRIMGKGQVLIIT